MRVSVAVRFGVQGGLSALGRGFLGALIWLYHFSAHLFFDRVSGLVCSISSFRWGTFCWGGVAFLSNRFLLSLWEGWLLFLCGFLVSVFQWVRVAGLVVYSIYMYAFCPFPSFSLLFYRFGVVAVVHFLFALSVWFCFHLTWSRAFWRVWYNVYGMEFWFCVPVVRLFGLFELFLRSVRVRLSHCSTF